jgi:dipeptidyl aminopeptidase/acylaminoacyl peptidase
VGTFPYAGQLIKRKIMFKIKILILLATALLPARKAFGASKINTSLFTTESPRLVSVTLQKEIPLQLLQSFTAGLGNRTLTEKVKYGVKTYTLVYETSFRGKTIKASGLILVPDNLKKSAPLLSIQHGTTFVKDDAPSVSGGYSGMELFASAGYITLMPDFIGYGESSEIFHPYYDVASSADGVIDMIKSAKTFLIKEKIPFNDKLFLAGYSEGGYVTLAAAKEIDTNQSHGLTVTAVAAGAGGYDLVEMLRGVTTDTYYSYPSYLAFVLMSYNNTYDWKKPLTYFFNDRYAKVLAQYMTGEHDGWFINSKLTTNVKSLFNETFYSNLKKPSGETELKQRLSTNSVSGWKTNIPIRLYHGTKDEIIPYQNSEVTLKNFIEAGSKDVTLKLIPGGTHGSSYGPMLQYFVPWFEQMK